jgi:demethylmenaquinone methyltransferase/2-methoxy-6-polyprenyl-1,4-benzoquinol methylase
MPPTLPPEKQDSSLMREMFSVIAPRYDFITRVFSYGMDMRWKRLGVERAALGKNARVLDLACGTGDFSKLVAARLPEAQAVAVDLTHDMLRLAAADGIRHTVCADAMRLPFPDASFDAVFVGYGLRNFPDLDRAAAEIARVTRPGGVFVSLDFFLPANAVWRKLYLGYLTVQGACWGFLLHGKPRIYTYIPDSLRSFVSMEDFSARLGRAGYGQVGVRGFLFGGIALHHATRR